MKAKGNGAPIQCVNNLLSIVRGEAAFDRIRGIDARLYDKSSKSASEELEREAIWNVEIYEPRININNASIITEESEAGSFVLTAILSDINI